MKTQRAIVLACGLVATISVAEAALATEEVAETVPATADVAARFGLEHVAVLPSEPLLDDYLGFALFHNGDLAATAAAQEAARARVDWVGALPEPRLTWSESIEPVETRLGPQERSFALTQQFPWFGTLGLQEDIAMDRATSAAARVDAVALAILREVRTTYHELVYLEQALETTEGHLGLLVQYEAVARSRYETGDGTYADVIKAQVEMAQLEDRRAELGDRRRPLTARFNAALGRPVVESVRVAAVEPPASPFDLATLQTRMLGSNPDLAGLESNAESFLKSGRLAGKQRWPGLSLGVNYILIGEAPNPDLVDSGRDAFVATLGVTLPLWQGSYGAAEREADGQYRAVEYRRSDLARQLFARLEQADFENRDARRRYLLYRDVLLPKARQSLAAARSTYEAGDASFLALIDAERILLEFELSGKRAVADLMISLAEIERLVAGQVHDPAAQKEE